MGGIVLKFALVLILLSGSGMTALAGGGQQEWRLYRGDALSGESIDWSRLHEAAIWESHAAAKNQSSAVGHYWVKLTVPQSLPEQAAFFFRTRNHEVAAYQDERLIYSYGTLQPRNDLLGSTWHMVALPSDAAGNDLYLRVYGNYAGDWLLVEGAQFGSVHELYRQLVSDNLDYLLSTAVGLFMVLLMIVTWIGMRERIYLYTALLFLVLTLWTMGETPLSLFYANNAQGWLQLSLTCVYLIPTAFVLVTQEFLSGKSRNVVRISGLPFAIYGVAVIGCDFWRAGTLRDGLDFFYILTLFGVILWSWALYASIRQGREDARWLAIGLAIMPFFAIYDIMGLQWRLFPWKHHLTHLATIVMALVLLRSFVCRMEERNKFQLQNCRLAAEMAEVTRMSQLDALTGVYNRAKFNEIVEGGMPRGGCLILFDIDFFKKINDTWGHDVGDRVLIELAQQAKAVVRDDDVVARMGGEEFAVLCSGMTLREARIRAELLRGRISSWSFAGGKKLTCSFGVSSWREKDTPESFFKRADQALYQAKEAGRNQVCSEPE